MRQLQDTLTKWGKDVWWIYYFQDGRDGQGDPISRPTISETELSRLTRSINMQLQVVQDGNRRGIKVVWARHGNSQMVIWDESQKWIGMPERIEQAVYGGLDGTNPDRRLGDVPKQFPNIETAIEWAISKAAFTDVRDARKIYDELKQKHQPRNATKMARHWTKEVLQRHALQENRSAAESKKPFKGVSSQAFIPEIRGKFSFYFSMLIFSAFLEEVFAAKLFPAFKRYPLNKRWNCHCEIHFW
jgi:hypothetical protein